MAQQNMAPTAWGKAQPHPFRALVGLDALKLGLEECLRVSERQARARVWRVASKPTFTCARPRSTW